MCAGGVVVGGGSPGTDPVRRDPRSLRVVIVRFTRGKRQTQIPFFFSFLSFLFSHMELVSPTTIAILPPQQRSTSGASFGQKGGLTTPLSPKGGYFSQPRGGTVPLNSGAISPFRVSSCMPYHTCHVRIKKMGTLAGMAERRTCCCVCS